MWMNVFLVLVKMLEAALMELMNTDCICITGYIGTDCEGNLIFGHFCIYNVMKNNCLERFIFVLD